MSALVPFQYPVRDGKPAVLGGVIPAPGEDLSGGKWTYTGKLVRKILYEAHAHYETQLQPRAGLAQPDAEPTDTQMLDWMIASYARIVLQCEGGPYYVYHWSVTAPHSETYGPNVDTPRAAIAAAMKEAAK